MTLRQRGGVVRRRMFSANIGEDGGRSVILFEGENAEENCREYISRHASLWHPNILQIFGVSHSYGTHAVITHDELMPYEDYLDFHQLSTIPCIYLHALWASDIYKTQQYFRPRGTGGDSIPTRWIRRSSGRLCLSLDLEPSNIREPYPACGILVGLPPRPVDWNDSTWETNTFEVLSVSDFHSLSSEVSFEFHYIQIDLGQYTDMRLGAVFLPSFPLEGHAEVAFLPDIPWEWEVWQLNGLGTVMEDGWTRFNSHETYGSSAFLPCGTDLDIKNVWMSQANHIFKQLRILSGYDAYLLIHWFELEARIQKPSAECEPSQGYLFLPPFQDFPKTSPNSFPWPECPWFWSLDSSGRHPLNGEEARSHGFPAVHMRMACGGRSWNTSVYEALRTFHVFKGFDPDSQEVAIHLGHPLFELSCERGDSESFAHVCEVKVQDELEDEDTTEPSRGIVLDQSTSAQEASHTSDVLPSVLASDVALPGRKVSNWVTSLWDWGVPEFGSLC
ncbi:hypothetical protein FB45DRAFT_921405 [Roridomyces roridus]|uniref:Uncharacterized protein n=1 Tax=Roridomyces roridus TaxID=1738132 RepID=A0AAD7BQI6_9AGAR|nr:hypothetical protein FB45DRAFT_921405 [Roridomyces roridus]